MVRVIFFFEGLFTTTAQDDDPNKLVIGTVLQKVLGRAKWTERSVSQ